MAKGVTGYVAYPAVQNATVVDRDITVTFLYYKDEIGTNPTNPDKPDGVLDEFQAVVFKGGIFYNNHAGKVRKNQSDQMAG